MKGYESLGIGFALLLVPIFAWISGRSAGRRDFGVMAVIMLAVIASVAGHLTAIVASSALEVVAGSGKATIPTIIEWRVSYFGSFPEFLAFLGAFGIFVAMVGWSSVPAANGTTVAR